MELKDRKLIANGAIELPKFDLGAELDAFKMRSGGSLPSLTGGPDFSKTGLSDDALAAANKNAMASLPQKGGVGSFLKNNAAGIANTAMSALNFASTIGGLSKNTMTADEMMGSGGQVENNANGISYQESRVDANSIQDQINAQASAATMGGVTSGASLGGSLGSLFGPLGTGIGTVAGGLLGGIAGILGGKSAKREAERLKEIAINRTNAMNALNRETAYTIGLRNEFNRENKTGINQSLFHAAEGKEGAVNPITMETYKKHIVNTAYGKTKAPLNAWVSKGEVIRSKDGSLYKVKTGSNDTARAYLQDGDSVYSKKIINPETGNPVAEDAPVYAAMGMLDRLDMNLNVGRMMKYTGRRKDNILPGYLGGTLKKFSTGEEDYDLPFTETWKRDADYLSRIYSGTKSPYFTAAAAPQTYTLELPEVTITPSNTKTKTSPTRKIGKGIGNAFKSIGNIVGGLDFGNMLATANAFYTASLRDAKAKGIRAPKSYMANPYENAAIDELNKLHSDYYTVWAGNREAEGRAKSAIAQSGGLGAGQRMLAYMGMLNQTQQNNAKSMFDAQNINNELKAQAAKIKLATGENSATRRQNAYQWDEDMLAKAHAAQLGLWETSAYDRQNALTLYFKNRWEKNLFDRTMNLYESQLKNDRAKTQAIINSLGTKNTPVTLTGVEGNASMVAIDPTTGKLVRTNPFSASQLLSEDTKKSIGNLNNIVSTAANAVNSVNTGAAPKIKRPEVSKPSSKKNATRKKITLTKDSMGQQFANIVATPQKKNKPVTTKAEEKKSVKPVKKYTPIPFGNAAIQERFPDASEEAKKDRPFKERAGRPAATTNSELRRRAVEWFVLGKKRYEEKYGKD